MRQAPRPGKQKELLAYLVPSRRVATGTLRRVHASPMPAAGHLGGPGRLGLPQTRSGLTGEDVTLAGGRSVPTKIGVGRHPHTTAAPVPLMPATRRGSAAGSCRGRVQPSSDAGPAPDRERTFDDSVSVQPPGASRFPAASHLRRSRSRCGGSAGDLLPWCSTRPARAPRVQPLRCGG